MVTIAGDNGLKDDGDHEDHDNSIGELTVGMWEPSCWAV